jgi:hypothetical protein
MFAGARVLASNCVFCPDEHHGMFEHQQPGTVQTYAFEAQIFCVAFVAVQTGQLKEDTV